MGLVANTSARSEGGGGPGRVSRVVAAPGEIFLLAIHDRGYGGTRVREDQARDDGFQGEFDEQYVVRLRFADPREQDEVASAPGSR